MERQYILSERAHFMCPNMHYGIAAEIDDTFNETRLRASLDALADAHPFLKSTVQYEDTSSRLFYQVENVSKISIYIRDEKANIWEDYKNVGEKEWNVFDNGLLKVFVYPKDNKYQILFVAHHLLGDGRCIMELLCEYANHYVKGLIPTYVEEQLMKGISDLPKKSNLAGISRLLVKRMNRLWKKENSVVTYESYDRFVTNFAKDNPYNYQKIEISKEKLSQIKELCKDHGVSVNDFLMAKIYKITGTPKIIIAVDVREQIRCYREGSMGNYSSAIGIVCQDKSDDIMELARKVHTIVRNHREDNRKLLLVLACYLNMNPTLLDAVALATLGDFKSKAAKFVGSAMFGFAKRDGVSLTNLGKYENEHMNSAFFIPPLSPSAKEVFGVLTLNGKMEIVSSYYEKFITQQEIKRQLDAMV